VIDKSEIPQEATFNADPVELARMSVAVGISIFGGTSVHHADQRYHEVYRQYGNQLGGFPGLWDLLAMVALELHLQTDIAHPEIWDEIDLISTLDNMVDVFFQVLLDRKQDLNEPEKVCRVAKLIATRTIQHTLPDDDWSRYYGALV
jgi:hypothetical protein